MTGAGDMRGRDGGADGDAGARPLLAVSGLGVEFSTPAGPLAAVRGVDFTVAAGETVCVVGESGSGKSVSAMAIMRLVEFGGGRIVSGRIELARGQGETVDLTRLGAEAMRTIRGAEIGMIFQEPMTALNPVFTIGRQLVDGLTAHRGLRGGAARARALELLREVRIPEPERRLDQYPHELSGGMRQRVVIAMAMACEPRLLIADEPTTALDVTIQAEILALIDGLRRRNGMGVLFITHDMAVVAQMADRVVVMYRGAVVETGSVAQIFAAPRHDYTRALLSAVPRLGAMKGRAQPAPLTQLARPPAPGSGNAPGRGAVPPASDPATAGTSEGVATPSAPLAPPADALSTGAGPRAGAESAPPVGGAGTAAPPVVRDEVIAVPEGRAGAVPASVGGASAGGRDAAPAVSVPPVLSVRHLAVRFPIRGGLLRRLRHNVHAVEDVSFVIPRGQTLSLVGESGCGKSSCGRAIMRLVEPAAGEVVLDGRDIITLERPALRRARRDIQMVFQDPFASLNPYRRLHRQVAEPLVNFDVARGAELEARVAALFDRVELPRAFLRRFPHELSGGQRQRVAIARALALHPKVIIADEAVSALDVSVQAQVLNLMMELQADLGLSYLFISHDMAVVERVSHLVGVMYLGRIVELGPRAAIFEDPRHPYTRGLLAAVPIADPARRQIRDDLRFRPVPSPVHPAGHEPARSLYDEVAPGHFVIREPAAEG